MRPSWIVEYCRDLGTAALVLLAMASVGQSLVAQEFQRGNCNNDCTLDISDPIFLAQHLFQSGAAPSCEKACDTNDDGTLDIADIVSTLMALFGTPTLPLPAPYLVCGEDPTPDSLSCVVSSCNGMELTPHGLVATVQGSQVILTWSNADLCAGFTEVRIVRRLNAPPTGPDDPEATQVFQGPAIATAEPLLALLPNTPETARTYHYAVYGCTSTNFCNPAGSVATLTPTVVQCLLGGGYTLYFRHALATTCNDRTDLGTAATTTEPGWWTSCDPNCPPAGDATARQIDPAGIVQATIAGMDMATRGIPVGRVISSEFCRCVTTADLLGFAPPTELDPGITFFVYDEFGRCMASLGLLAEVPTMGTNTILVGHVGMTCQLLGTLAVAEAMLYKPDGVGGSQYLTRIPYDTWLSLP